MSLPTTNKIIAIKRLNSDNDIRDWATIDDDVSVYINAISEELATGMDAQPAFFAFRMMTDGEHSDILIGDRIEDDAGDTYEVRGMVKHDSIVGAHHQYILAKHFS